MSLADGSADELRERWIHGDAYVDNHGRFDSSKPNESKRGSMIHRSSDSECQVRAQGTAEFPMHLKDDAPADYGVTSGRIDSSKPNESNAPKNLSVVNRLAAGYQPLSFEEYQDAAHSTAVFPHQIPDRLAGVVYCALGLAGEAGEIANKVKKLLRDVDTTDKRRAIAYECGDVMWYIPELLHELGEFRMEQVARENLEKLFGRKERGTLHGSGDVR